jgi:hypothetical protein
MSRIIKNCLNGLAFLIAAQLIGAPGHAQTVQIGSGGFVTVGSKHLSFQKHRKHKVNRYYLAPKASSHVKRPKVHHKRPAKVLRHYSPKRRVFGHIPHRQIKRHKFKTYKFRHTYGFQRN